MRMAYWMRVAVGVLLGLAGLVALWKTVGIGWLTATVSMLLAALGFLGSYFVISADRPEDGYEQVLFDRPNTLVALALLVVFAGAGFGTGFLPAAESTPDPAQAVHALRADYLALADGHAKATDKNATLATLASLRQESDWIASDLAKLPEGPARKALEDANDAFALALDDLKVCIEKGASSCLDARLKAADGESALARYQTTLGETA